MIQLVVGPFHEERDVLVLTRKIDEEIRIGEDIVVKVCGIRGSRVRIGIEAPPGLRIERRELLDSVNSGEQPCSR